MEEEETACNAMSRVEKCTIMCFYHEMVYCKYIVS